MKIEIDVTAFVQTIKDTSDFIGFILKPGAYVDEQAIGFWNGIPHPIFGPISGQVARLSIQYSVQ